MLLCSFLFGWFVLFLCFFFPFSLLVNLMYTFKLEKRNLDMVFSYTVTFMTKETKRKNNYFPLVCYISVNTEGDIQIRHKLALVCWDFSLVFSSLFFNGCVHSCIQMLRLLLSKNWHRGLDLWLKKFQKVLENFVSSQSKKSSTDEEKDQLKKIVLLL